MKRLSLRARLAFMFSGLVLVAGLLLLGVTYLLVDSRMPHTSIGGVQFNPGPGMADSGSTGSSGSSANAAGQPSVSVNQLTVRSTTGEQFNAADLPGVFRDSTLRTLLTQGGIALGAVAGLAGAFAWLIAGRTLQPLHRITETARRIGGAAATGRGLHERIALGGPQDEVRQLADTFDAMLERLDRSFEGQRRFVANASHELRTPLAINRALVEVAVTRPNASPDARRLGEALLQVNSRHERLIDGLLMLADSENEPAERSAVDLADVAEHVLQVSSPSTVGPAGADVTVRTPQLSAAPTTGDPLLLERLVQNLVENAFRHNVPGGWIAVETGTVGQTVVLTVTNTGPLVPKYEVESIFQPFRRLTGERTSEHAGSRSFGLGLSIVRAVATAHGGSVSATPRDAEEGGGLVVRVTLPQETSPG